MSFNHYRKHLLVLPEDKANSEIAIGFHQEIGIPRQMFVLPSAGGWAEALTKFKSEHVRPMLQFQLRYLLLLVDFDGKPSRLNQIRAEIPPNLGDRVFVLGSRKEPEDLKAAGLGHFEAIGEELARECRQEEYLLWEHELLRHNQTERDRLNQATREILFPYGP